MTDRFIPARRRVLSAAAGSAVLGVGLPSFAQAKEFKIGFFIALSGPAALFGPTPAELLPATTDEELFAFVRRDLRDFWLPATRKRTNWYADIWVDLSLLTLARAHVTLATGDLITKRAALDVLPGLGAPTSVVDDIRARRYGPVPRTWPWWRHRRGVLARRFTSTAIPAVLS